MLLEMHYDNPNEVSGKLKYSITKECVMTFNYTTGIVDSSGFRMYYTDTPRQEDVGILAVGHNVIGHMIIPPRVQHYVVQGFCSSDCTNHVSAN